MPRSSLAILFIFLLLATCIAVGCASSSEEQTDGDVDEDEEAGTDADGDADGDGDGERLSETDNEGDAPGDTEDSWLLTGPAWLSNGVIEVRVDQDTGSVTIKDLLTGCEVRGLHQAVEIEDTPGKHLETSLGKPAPCRRETSGSIVTALDCEGRSASFTVNFHFSLQGDDAHILSYQSSFTSRASEAVQVKKFYPFRLAASDGGALLVGEDAAQVRVLQNGSDEFADFYVALLPGDAPLSNPDMNVLFQDYSSFSSGHILAHDLGQGASLLAGFVDFDWAVPLVATGGEKAGATAVDGRIPLTKFWGEARYPSSVSVAPDHTISGGSAVFILGEASPFDALETYAAVIADSKDIKLPPLPYSGWDSWYTGAAVTGITEVFIEEQADGLSELFYDFGLDSMQLDVGWQDSWGDWKAHANFPSGMSAIAEHIKSRGLKPELWVAPFSAEESSELYQEHGASWFLPKNAFGSVLMDAENHALDLSREDVMDYITELGERIRLWGFESVKMDFAYYYLLSVSPPEVDKTPVRLYREGIKAFREALGEDVYFINISMCFPNYGLVDAFRIGLDTWPCWNGGKECEDLGYPNSIGPSAQGIKPGVRMAARRYWMNGRIWWNHNDQIFFRDLELEENRAFVSFASLSGGMISLGEESSSIQPERAELYRKILPLQGLTARPLDLFTREYPEQWHLQLDEGESRTDLLGLFHWGANLDHNGNPPVERADGEPLTHNVNLVDLGLADEGEYLLYEFWTGEFRVIEEALTVELDPHTARVYKLVKKPDRPVYLAGDRHLLMGPGIVEDTAYDPLSLTLSGRGRSVKDYEQTLVFWLPEDMTATDLTFPDVDVITETEGRLLKLSFTGKENEFYSFVISFQKE